MRRKQLTFTLINGILILLLMGLWSSEIAAISTQEEEATVYGVKVQEKIKIDGVLDEKTWQTPPIKKTFISHTPLFGDELPMETLVWVAYDTKKLYFAFQCADPDPGKIKTSITKRDNMFGDDWVAVSIDATGNGQTGYVLYVNPNGIQGDALTFAMHVDDDRAPDFVWQSAAQMTDSGYNVEIGLPLKSIKFQSGKDVKMGILFMRRISRHSYIGAWPEIKPNHWILDSQAKAAFTDLKKQTRIEVLPALTHSDNRSRLTPQEWSDSETSTQFGIGLKYGITSTTTAEVTINPDFSQVESDAFQVEVNQRYPLFYSEKRPFFMEGTGIFNFWTYVYGFFPKAVHTRQIVDPSWGAKLTGNVGKFSFGILSAGDEAPGQPWAFGTNPNEGDSALFSVARGKYSLGGDSYIGFLYTGRDFGDEYNRVIGADVSFRLAKKHWFRSSYLHTLSRDSEGNVNDGPNTGYGTFVYTYGSKRFVYVAVLEHMGRDLQVDAGYLRRNAVNVVRSGVYLNFYPNQKKVPWLKLITPVISVDLTHDLNTHKDDIMVSGALTFYFTKDATLGLNYLATRENWQGQAFDLDLVGFQGGIRLSKWLKLSGNFFWREGIYYYADPAFMGSGYMGGFSADIQPSNKLNQYFSYTHADLSREGEELYDVNILYSKTTYQFNKYFFLRAVVQYNSFQKRLLTDLLASFTLIPGTVLHIGYGGLYEKQLWVNDQWLPLQGDLYNTKRSFFAKVSYLWRF